MTQQVQVCPAVPSAEVRLATAHSVNHVMGLLLSAASPSMHTDAATAARLSAEDRAAALSTPLPAGADPWEVTEVLRQALSFFRAIHLEHDPLVLAEEFLRLYAEHSLSGPTEKFLRLQKRLGRHGRGVLIY